VSAGLARVWCPSSGEDGTRDNISLQKRPVIRRELESSPGNETGASARGNVARLYLGMDRAPYPASIGYHPGRNGLIAIATDSTGQITGGHSVA
jgi:hypothetical protein